MRALRGPALRRLDSANIRPLGEVAALLRYRKKSIVLLALVALLVAQAAAGLHALRHFGMQGDPLGLPDHHVQMCLECASFVPLNSLLNGAVVTVQVAAPGPQVLVAAGEHAEPTRRHIAPFRSRAPPG